MLNKELLMVTEGKTEWYTELTVGSSASIYGYSTDKDLLGIFGSISKEPSWAFKGKSCTMRALTTYEKATRLFMENVAEVKDYFSEITVTVVEKNLTSTFNYSSIFCYESQAGLFTPYDVGKTFTIVFDPEPTGYV